MSSVGSRSSSRRALARSACRRRGRRRGSRRGRRPSAGRGRRRTRRRRRAASWAAVSTSMRRTPAGSAGRRWRRSAVTSAPRRAAAAARAMPMRPLERLPMKRTGSIGSRVPPAVTSTRSPSQGRSPRRQRRLDPGQQRARGRAGGRGRARRARRACPRRARSPRPRARAGSPGWPGSPRRAYMRSFIAGATSRGAAQARKEVVSIESALPAASLAIVLAEAGATRKASQLAASSRWPIGSCAGRVVAGEGAAHRVALELGGQHRGADDALEGGGADEAGRRLGHQHPHAVAGQRSPGARTRAPCRRLSRR